MAVHVQPGQRVAAGAPLYRVESMKMEQVVTAPEEAVVIEVRGKPGQTLARGDVIVVLAPVAGPGKDV